MIFTNYPITLDVHSILSQVSIPVPQYDTARRLSITLTEEGKPYMIPDGCRAAFTGTKADGTDLYNDCIIENNTIIRYDFTEQTAAAIGKVDCQIKLYGENGLILTSPRLTLVVYESALDDVVVSEDEINVINGIMLAEAERVAAEESRVAAEEARVEAEETRVTAEQEREAAEAERVAAETARQEAAADLKKDISDRVETMEAQITNMGEQVDGLQEKFDNLDVTVDIPTYDLVTLGLPMIDIGGADVELETDTAEILADLEAGAVRFAADLTYQGINFTGIVFTMHDISNSLCSCVFSVWGIPILVTLTIETGKITANGTLLAVDDGEEEAAELPTFDLTALGLPSVPITGEQVYVAADTTEIMAALDEGPVKFAAEFLLDDEEMPVEIVMNKISLMGASTYICSYAFDVGEMPMIFNLYIQEGVVAAVCTNLAKATTPATSIDMTAFDSAGQIVETFADGTSKTTTIEFDEDSNPVKITDGDGNVTTLTW